MKRALLWALGGCLAALGILLVSQALGSGPAVEGRDAPSGARGSIDVTDPLGLGQTGGSTPPSHQRSTVASTEFVRVVDEQGSALPGVVVLGGDPAQDEFLESLTGALPHFEHVVRAGGSSTYGRATVAVTDDAGQCKPPTSSGRLLVADRNRGMCLVDWPIAVGGSRDITLHDRVAIEVCFLSPESAKPLQVYENGKPLLALTPDSTLRCSTPPLPPGRYEIGVPGQAPKEVVVPDTGPDLRIVMEDGERDWSALLCGSDAQAYDASRLRYELQVDPGQLTFLFAGSKPSLGGFANDRHRPPVRYDGISGRLSATHLPPGVTHVGVWQRLRLVGYATVDAQGGRAVLTIAGAPSTASVTFLVESRPGVPLDRQATIELGVLVGASFGSAVRVDCSPGVPCKAPLPEAMEGAEVCCVVRAVGFVPEWRRVTLPARDGVAVLTFTLRLAAHALAVEASGAKTIACIGQDNRWVTDHRTTVRTETGKAMLSGLPAGRLRVLAWNNTAFGHRDVTLPEDAAATVVVNLDPGQRVSVQNSMDRTVQLLATDERGVVVFDDRLFGNQRHGQRLSCNIPALARQLQVDDTAGQVLARAALPLVSTSIALDR